MSFYEHASTRIFEVTQKKPIDLKLLITGRLDYPRIQWNGKEHRIILPKPTKTKTGSYKLHRIDFPELEMAPLLQMFTASVYHLGIHVVASDFTVYHEWSQNKNRYLARFVKSLVEDAAADAYLKASWTGVRPVIAYANAISFLRLREAADKEILPRLSLHQAVLSLQLAGTFKGEPAEKKEDAKKIAKRITDFEESIITRCGEREDNPDDKCRLAPQATAQERLEAATDIWEILRDNAPPLETPSRPYGEDWGGDSLFDQPVSFAEDFSDVLQNAYNRLGLNFTNEEFLKDQARVADEAARIFDVENVQAAATERALKHYVEMGSGLNFRSYVVPAEDYSEYSKVRSRLAGPIRRILEEARKVKHISDDSPLEESGLVDLQAAVQVVASNSMRNDIFTKEEILQKSEAWAILVDASLSLRMFEIDVRSVAVCLSEVAKDLISSPNSWGLFAFSDTYQIVKDFYEPYSNRAKAKIGGLKHGGLSYIPDAVELTANSLANTGEDVKILLLISDCIPLGYADINARFNESLKKARSANITPIVIGIGNRRVQDQFKPSCSIESSFELMKQFIKTYLEVQAFI